MLLVCICSKTDDLALNNQLVCSFLIYSAVSSSLLCVCVCAHALKCLGTEDLLGQEDSCPKESVGEEREETG